MLAQRIKPGALVKTSEGVLYVQDAEYYGEGLNRVASLTGRVYPKGRKPHHDTFQFWCTEDVPLCTWDGVPTEGRTKGEIEAETVYRRLTAAGVRAEMDVEHDVANQRVISTVRIRGDYDFDDLFSGSWFSRTEGRKTTRFFGFTVRGMYRSPRKSISAKLGRKQFFQAVGSACFMGEYKGEYEDSK
jgi:hypothetical protein